MEHVTYCGATGCLVKRGMARIMGGEASTERGGRRRDGGTQGRLAAGQAGHDGAGGTPTGGVGVNASPPFPTACHFHFSPTTLGHEA